MASINLATSIDENENPSTFRQNEQDNTTNIIDRKNLDKLECDKSLTISSGGYENLPSPMNCDSKEKINYDKNVSEINFGRRYDENVKTNKNNNKQNEEFLKFIADNSGKNC